MYQQEGSAEVVVHTIVRCTEHVQRFIAAEQVQSAEVQHMCRSGAEQIQSICRNVEVQRNKVGGAEDQQR